MTGFVRLLILGIGLLTIAGCPAFIAGAGAGAGVYTYTAGEMKRTYPADFDTTVAASLESLDELKISVQESQASGITTRITAERTDSTPVTVTVHMVGQTITEVRVRSGLVGYWDKQGSELIHATLAKRLASPD